MLKGQSHEIFCDFFISWIEAIWAPDKWAKRVLLKNSFLRRYSDSAQHCAKSTIEMSANPKLANTARSQTLRRLTLCRVRLRAG